MDLAYQEISFIPLLLHQSSSKHCVCPIRLFLIHFWLLMFCCVFFQATKGGHKEIIQCGIKIENKHYQNQDCDQNLSLTVYLETLEQASNTFKSWFLVSFQSIRILDSNRDPIHLKGYETKQVISFLASTKAIADPRFLLISHITTQTR